MSGLMVLLMPKHERWPRQFVRSRNGARGVKPNPSTHLNPKHFEHFLEVCPSITH